MNGAALASRMSPAIPLPPIPRMTTFSMSSWARQRVGVFDLDSRPPPRRPVLAGRRRRPTSLGCRGRAPSRSCSQPGVMFFAVAFASRRFVLGVIGDGGCVVEEVRDVVGDRILPLQPRVVEELLVREIQQRTLVLRDTPGRSTVLGPEPRQPSLTMARTSLVRASHSSVAARLEVEAQQRFGIGRTHIEPPRVRFAGQAVQARLLHVAERGRDLLDRRRGSVTVVLISPDAT